MRQKVFNFVKLVRQKGLRPALNYARERILLPRYEASLGINTTVISRKEELGISDCDYADYVPMNYSALYRLLRRIPIQAGEDVFMDYGSGRGRIVLVAATFPFKRAIGIELSASLVAAANENLKAAMPKLACKDVEFLAEDATRYTVPPDASVIFFVNPFHDNILRLVLGRIRESIEAAPRRVIIAYVNANDPTTRLLHNTSWLKVRDDYHDWCMLGTWRRILILESVEG